MNRIILLFLFSSGCGAIMCSFTGNAIGHCPALKQAAAQTQASSGGESEESSPPESSEPSGGGEAKQEEAAPAKAESRPGCRPSGAVCDQSYQCCSEACVTHSPDDYCR